MFADGRGGCVWVCMGAVGCAITNAQANNTKRDRNGLEGYDSPKKSDIYVRADLKG